MVRCEKGLALASVGSQPVANFCFLSRRFRCHLSAARQCLNGSLTAIARRIPPLPRQALPCALTGIEPSDHQNQWLAPEQIRIGKETMVLQASGPN